MSIDANTYPVGLPAEQDHYVCCYPDRALCGRLLAGGEWVDPDAPPDTCEHCEALLDRPCARRFCRLRQWWRKARGIRWSEVQK